MIVLSPFKLFVTCLVLALALCQCPAGQAADESPTFKKVSFYFSPHEDDWQLFMNPPAFDDVLSGDTKAVFVHMTAGDAGLGTGSDGRKHPYYLARENGSRTAIRFMADAGQRPSDQSESKRDLNGHSIYRVAYRNTVAYFFRVPDGSGEGTGYNTTGFQSLKRFAGGEIKTLSAVDGSASYNGWQDLVSTVRALYDYERRGIDSIQLNVPELDEKLNPGDHSDHRYTARSALEAGKDLPNTRRFHYLNYVTADLPENLNYKQKEMETSVFAATVTGLTAFDHESTWAPHYWSFLGRGYYRIEGPSNTARQ